MHPVWFQNKTDNAALVKNDIKCRAANLADMKMGIFTRKKLGADGSYASHST